MRKIQKKKKKSCCSPFSIAERVLKGKSRIGGMNDLISFFNGMLPFVGY